MGILLTWRLVRHVFNSPKTYLGLSLQVHSEDTNQQLKSQLKAIDGVISVSQVCFKFVGYSALGFIGTPWR